MTQQPTFAQHETKRPEHVSYRLRRGRMLAAAWRVAALVVLQRAHAQVSSDGREADGRAVRRQAADAVCMASTSQQRLNQQIPLDRHFVDETGKTVKLGDYFGKRPSFWRWCITSARCSVRRS